MEIKKVVTIIILLFEVVQWISWTPETCLLRQFIPLGTFFSFLLSVVPLGLGLLNLHKSGLLTGWGAYISYRYLSYDWLLKLRTGTAGFLKYVVVIFLGVLCLSFLIVALRIFALTDSYAKEYFTITYLLAFTGLIANASFIPEVLEWSHNIPFSTKGIGVFKVTLLGYVEDPRTLNWHKPSAQFAKLIDQRGCFFTPGHLQKVIKIPLSTAVYEGTISVVLNAGDITKFPDCFTAQQMAHVETYFTDIQSIIPLVEPTINAKAALFTENVKAQLSTFSNPQFGFNSNINIQDSIAKIIDSMQKIDHVQIADSISDVIHHQIFGKNNRTILFAVMVNTDSLTLKYEYAQIRDTMLTLSQQLAIKNADNMTAMTPLLMNSTIQEPADYLSNLQKMMTNSPNCVSNQPPTMPKLVIYPEITDEMLRYDLKKLRQLQPNVSFHDALAFIQRDLRDKKMLSESQALDQEKFAPLFFSIND